MWRDIDIRLLMALVAGIVAGVLDLWIYQLSVRGFLAGLAAGVAYYLVVIFFYVPGMRQAPWFLFGFAIVAGVIGGTAWWLVCHGSRYWVAISVASVLSLAYFASSGFFSQRG
jgi:hypothetical protein